MSTGTTANSSAMYESNRRARFAVGGDLLFTGAFKYKTVVDADNVRRCGIYDDDNGYYFQLDGSTYSIGTRKSGVDTLVSSGSFNGDHGSTFSPTTETAYYKLDIEYTPMGAFWYINETLLHSIFPVGHLTDFLTLPIRFECYNSNGNTTDNKFDCLATVVSRLGQLETNPTYKYISSNTTTVCKVGAGSLHRIIIPDNVGDVYIYDNTAGSGTLICDLDTSQGSEPLGSVEFSAPFSDGLTIVTTGGAKLTVIYE